mgnify:CR=1 FL=1
MGKRKTQTGIISYMSGTTTWSECFAALRGRKSTTDYVGIYHEKIRKLLDVKYVYSFCSGRAALYALLKAMGIKKGDEVLIEGYTCVAVPKAIIYAGGIPSYADINENDYGVTYESVKERINEKTFAVVVQHTYGIACEDIFRIYDLCKQKGIYLIEDCAHTLGATYQGKRLGCIGDAAFFSTDHTKYISTCVGGFCITNVDDIGNKLDIIYKATAELTKKENNSIVRQFFETNFIQGKSMQRMLYKHYALQKLVWRWQYIKMKLGRSYYLDDYDNFDAPKYTFPAKLPNVMAMVGVNQLNRLDENTRHRKQITDIYRRELTALINIPKECDAPVRVPILLRDEEEQRLFSEMTRDIMLAGQWFTNTVVCIPKSLNRAAYYDEGTCPLAESITRRVVNIPNHEKVTEEDAYRICKRINEIVNRWHDDSR